MKTTAKSVTGTRRSAHRAAIVVLLASALLVAAPLAQAQGSRKDDIVFGPGGHPVAGATVRVCQPTATGTPCMPLATVYTDATLTTAAANPFQTDGIGNYHFYAAAGRYQIQISSSQISGTVTQPDVILPADLSSSGSGNNISAFGLTLGGNLSVAGNAAISGTLTASSFNPGALNPTSLNVTGSSTVAGPRPYIDVTSPQYGAVGDGGTEQTSGTINAGSNQLTIGTTSGTWKVGMGLYVIGAGASGDVLLAKVTAINGNILTLDRNAARSVVSSGVQNDDTLAIQAAISAFCGSITTSNGGSIYFPPGNYSVAQYQSVNPNGVPFSACTGIHFVGGNSAAHNGTPFVRPPTASILTRCLPSPNAQPVFGAFYPANNITFENLVITGCNQALGSNSQVLTLINTHLSVGTSGLADNSALHLFNTFWIFIHGGSLNGTTSAPSLLMTGDNCGGSCYDGVGDLYMDGTLLSGGNIQYIQRANQTGASPGHWVFSNITQESGNTDLISISDTGSYALGMVGPITLDDVQDADNSSGTAALINFNATGVPLSGVEIRHSLGGNGGTSGPAIKITAGKAERYNVDGCISGCSTMVVDGSGNPIGNGMTQGTGGIDFTSDVTDPTRLNSSSLSNFNTSGAGPSARFFQAGNLYASYGIDPANGWMFGSKTQSGWNAQFYQSTLGNIDVAYAANFPPTGVSASVVSSGGSLGVGTYYLYMASSTSSSSNCNAGGSGNLSAPSNIVGPVTVTVANSSLSITWTPSIAGLTPIQGYCVFLNGAAPQYNPATNSSNLISGAGTSSATVGSFPNSGIWYPYTQSMVNAHHLAPTFAEFSGAATPSVSATAPYTATCLATAACGAYMALSPVVIDSFGRTNSASLGTNWGTAASGGGLAALAVNSATATASGSLAGIQSWTGQTFLADQFSRATINGYSDGSGDLAGVTVRGTGTTTDTEYTFHCYHGSSVLTKRISGTETTLASGGPDCAAGNTIELDAVGTKLVALLNGTVVLTATDSSIASGAPGMWIWNSSDSLANWTGGSLPAGNGAQSILNQANTWTQPQTFASPITSPSLAVANKTRTCTAVRGDQSASALTTGNIQPQGSLCYIDANATVAAVIVMADAGASTMQLGYRHNGSTTAISPALTPVSVSGITDHVACANAGGTALTIEGNSVTCSTLSNTALASGDFIETIGGAADGTTKRMSVIMTYTPN